MISPKKSLSQNFLKDKNICKKIISQTNIKNNTILEIGPGYGFLTDFIGFILLIPITRNILLRAFIAKKRDSNKSTNQENTIDGEIVNKDKKDEL